MVDPADSFDDFLPQALQRCSPSPLVDIGANLTHASFSSDLESVLLRARAANVTTLILTGTDREHAEQAVALAERYPGLYATAGVHPHDASQWNASQAQAMSDLHRDPSVVAVGECGLDFNRNFSTPDEQEHAFEAQLGLAAESGLPLFLHERDAGKRMHEMLHTWRDDINDAVVHCFTADRDTLHGYLDLDLHIGLTGWLCDERRGHHLRELVSDIPLTRLMVETDCPYLLPRNLPAKLKGRRHEPALLPWIVREIAHWRGMPEAELAEATTATARAFFRLASTNHALTPECEEH
ncbi:TatD family hydrolase [Halomonas sp. TRM85114]|uniref:TatD family hydrolase n=1 Tax=Halomonas jincaotanensis TaxID=2810616 RepID=UPI001BD5A93C|nr:TatD family hydrolase [Halomonas jincaotanensis]MBS9405147.1 TatD family hydrolase [Halomonas jincaotanensis]